MCQPNLPIDESVAVFACVSVRAMTGVVGDMVVTSGAIVAGPAVAHVDTELTIGAGVAATKQTKLIWTFVANYNL